MRAELRSLFAASDPIDIAARMIFALFLLSSWLTTEHAVFLVPLRLIAFAGLLLPPLHRDARLWAAFTLVMLVKSLRFWFTQDNHVFLLTWFSLGMTLSLVSSDPLAVLRENARRLIGFAFAFAALWKGPLSGEFLDGSYFAYTFLTDSRFHGVARVLGGVSEEALRSNYAAVASLATVAVDRITLQGVSPRLTSMATGAAWWTLAIEGALAIAFLSPVSQPPLRAARHVLLLLFGATTYLVADVETFGWSLMALGVAQSEPEQPLVRAAYVGVALLIFTYDHIPVFDLVAGWI